MSRWFGYIGFNQQSYDFGVRANQLNNLSAVKEKMAEIEKDFDLILIAEYFDESLVLLADHLCWNLEDMVYLKLNSRVASAKVQACILYIWMYNWDIQTNA